MNRQSCLIGLAVLFMAAFTPAGLRADANDEYERAQRFESEGRVDAALEIYKKLYDTYGRDVYFWKLVRIFGQEHDYVRLEDLMRGKLESDPKDMEAMRYLARSLFGQGDRNEGRRVLMRLYNDNRDNALVVKIVGNEFIVQGEYDSALDLYSDVRRIFGEPTAFSLEVAQIYEILADYPRALEEYLRSPLESTSFAMTLKKALDNAREAGVSQENLIEPFLNHLAGNPGHIAAARIVSDMLYDEGSRDTAYQTIISAAELSGNPGDVYEFAGRALGDGFDELALEAYGAFYRLFPDAPRRVEALLASAAIETSLGRKDAARDDYNSLMNDYPGTEHAARAALRLMKLSRGEVRFAGYSETLETFAATVNHREVAREAYLFLGTVYLEEGMAQEALVALNNAKMKSRTKEELYEAYMRTARVQFCIKNYAAMNADLEACIRSGPARDEINDMLALKVLGLKCATPGDLHGYEVLSDGYYAVCRGDTAGAVDRFTKAAMDTTVVAPHAAGALAALMKSKGDYQGAVEWYLHAAQAASDTADTVGAMLLAADIVFEDIHDPERAKALYVKALTGFPGNVHESELRRKVRRVTE